MKKHLTCIECPNSCQLEAIVENGQVQEVLGYKCPVGETYAKREIEHPMRFLTTTVLAQGLSVKMVPVRTSLPIPKAHLQHAMAAVKKICLTRPVKVGEVIQTNLLSLSVDLIATRTVD